MIFAFLVLVLLMIAWYVLIVPRRMLASQPQQNTVVLADIHVPSSTPVQTLPPQAPFAPAPAPQMRSDEPTGWYEGVPVYMYSDVWDPRDTSHVHLHADDPASNPGYMRIRDSRSYADDGSHNFDNDRVRNRMSM